MEQIDKLIQSKQSRRRFLAGAGAVGAVGAATLLTGCNDSSSSSGTTPTPTPTPTPLDIPDNDILNFALNLEYLEAEFYLRAATGSGLPSALLLGGDGAVTGGGMIKGTIPTAITAYLNAIAQDEMNHVAALQATIKGNNGTPVPRPTIDFTAFAALGTLATIPTTFDPTVDVLSFLLGAFVFEDVGVTAYNGAAPAITSSTILDAAAGIAAVEAYHAAEIRTLIAGMASAAGATAEAMGTLTNANLISALRAKVGGGMETPLSINSIVAANGSTSVGFARSTSQVLSIVYANNTAGTASGGFFPNGLNGSIKTV